MQSVGFLGSEPPGLMTTARQLASEILGSTAVEVSLADMRPRCFELLVLLIEAVTGSQYGPVVIIFGFGSHRFWASDWRCLKQNTCESRIKGEWGLVDSRCERSEYLEVNGGSVARQVILREETQHNAGEREETIGKGCGFYTSLLFPFSALFAFPVFCFFVCSFFDCPVFSPCFSLFVVFIPCVPLWIFGY